MHRTAVFCIRDSIARKAASKEPLNTSTYPNSKFRQQKRLSFESKLKFNNSDTVYFYFGIAGGTVRQK